MNEMECVRRHSNFVVAAVACIIGCIYDTFYISVFIIICTQLQYANTILKINFDEYDW